MNEPMSFCDGRFVVLRKLGEGGMAAVYGCRDELLARRVAIKTPHPALLIQPKAMARFAQETLAMARMVSCGNVVQLLDARKDAAPDGFQRPVLVMEWVNGIGLDVVVIGSKKVRPFGPLPARSVCRVGIGLMRALVWMHALGVVHRDVKPSNLMLIDDVTLPMERGLDVKLMDFGIARLMELTDDERHTQTSGAMGSFSYMAPEQRLRPREAGPKADLYAVGATLYGIATGYDPGDLFYKELSSPEFQDLPEPLRGPIFRATRYDASERSPDTAAELLADFEAALAIMSTRVGDEPAFVDRPEQMAREAELRAWLAERREAVERQLAEVSPAPASTESIPSPTEAAESVAQGLTVWFQKADKTPPAAVAEEPPEPARTAVVPRPSNAFRNVAFGTLGVGLLVASLVVAFKPRDPVAETPPKPEPVAVVAPVTPEPKVVTPAVETPAPTPPAPATPTLRSERDDVGKPSTPVRPQNGTRPVATPAVPIAAPVDPPVTAPVPVVAPPETSHGYVQFDGSAQKVRLVGTDGASHGIGTLDPGTYQIKATFEGKDEVVAGTVTVLDGQTQTITCNAGFGICKAH